MTTIKYIGECLNSDKKSVGLPQAAASGVLDELFSAHKAYRTNVIKRKLAILHNPKLKEYNYERKFRNGNDYAKQRKGTIKIEWASLSKIKKKDKIHIPFLNFFSQHKFGGFKHHNEYDQFVEKDPNSCLRKVKLLISKRRMKKMGNQTFWVNNSGEQIYHYTHIPKDSLPRVVFLDFDKFGWKFRYTHWVPKNSKLPLGANDSKSISKNLLKPILYIYIILSFILISFRYYISFLSLLYLFLPNILCLF